MSVVKTYKSKRYAKLSIVVFTSAGPKHIDFTNGYINSHGLRGGIYTTADEEIQRLIEQHKDFKSGAIYVEKSAVADEQQKVVEKKHRNKQ